jgi:hypothetical protein
MAANTAPIFIKSALTTSANTQFSDALVNADSTNIVDIVNGATDGTLIQDLIAVTDDTSANVVKIYIYDGGASRQIGQVNVPAGSGTDATKASVSLLNVTNIPSLNKRDDGALFLASGQKIQVSVVAAVTSGKYLTITALGGNF